MRRAAALLLAAATSPAPPYAGASGGVVAPPKDSAPPLPKGGEEVLRKVKPLWGPSPSVVSTVNTQPNTQPAPPQSTPAAPATSPPTFPQMVQFGVDDAVDHTENDHNVPYPHAFDQTPVIIAGVPTQNGPDFFTIRVHSVTTEGFVLFGQESSCGANRNDNGVHTNTETVPWMAVADGRHTLGDGSIVEAGKLTLRNGHEQVVPFSSPIPGAVILATIQTKNGNDPVFLRITGRDDNGFKVRMQEDEGNTAQNGVTYHVAETVGWVAVTSGTGAFGGHAFRSFNTDIEVDHNWKTVLNNVKMPYCAFGSFSFHGTDGAVLRQRSTSPQAPEPEPYPTGDLQFRVQEDQCLDTETNHVMETLSVLVVPECHEQRVGKPPIREISGDPFVIDQTGKAVQFFLPLFTEELLLQCGGVKLYGSAIGTGAAGDHQQWFDRFRVIYNDQEVLYVSIARNLTAPVDAVDVSAPHHDITADSLSVLNVLVEGAPMTKTGAIGTSDAVLIAVWQNSGIESVQLSADNIVFQMKSAVAQKFTSKQQQRLYTHLDLKFIELDTSKCPVGILAEIWGTAPMSQRTAAFLHPPQ